VLGIISKIDLGSLTTSNGSGSYSWLEIWEVSLFDSRSEIDHSSTQCSACVFLLLTFVVMAIQVLWDVMKCLLVNSYRSFEETKGARTVGSR
jgi:hypothetical protein